MSFVKIRVRRSRTMSSVGQRNASRPHNWRVEQRITESTVRVFIYATHWDAMRVADALANCRRIPTWGLRGFHIEQEATK